jgi:ketosteroid isomerase-like protein
MMTQQQMIDMVRRYFAAVDSEDLMTLQQLLAADCVFSVETHGVELIGWAQIEEMFKRLWRNHAAVRHQQFVYVAAPEDNRISTQFQVVNTHHNGSVVHKSNCNFFKITNHTFSRVAVYMAGQNTLNGD